MAGILGEHRQRQRLGVGLPALVVVVLSLALAHGEPVAAPAQGPTLVGAAVCMTCHSSFAKLWASLKHSQAMSAETVPADKRGCEGCHGPGSEHVSRDRKKIVAWAKLDTAAQAKVCLQCHQKEGLSEELWFARDHSQALGCADCHEVHRPVKRDKLLKPAEGQECSPCHDDLADKIKAKTHHTLADGAVVCGNCHAFHGSKQRFLLAKPQAELCADCHDKDVPKPESHKRKDFKLKHKTEAKGKEAECHMCHDQPSFCDRCHTVKIPHAEEYVEKHEREAKAKPQACLSCHDAKFCGDCHEPLPAPFNRMVKEGSAK